ncbi:MAG TPA: proteasome accessory factor PafA2 family protein, partial [Jiangellales bacterium]|nr:proteasome accessory factor PafA2 family protein [Jiangellales bacterium]
LKVGSTSLVLAMVEEGFLPGDLGVEKPVTSLHRVSHDPTLRHLLTLTDGRTVTAVQLQTEYCEQARKFVEDRYGADADADTLEVLERWESVLSRLAEDPMLCVSELDWVAKLALLESYRDRDGLDWDHPKLHLVDLQYSDVRPAKGLYHRLLGLGRIERMVSDTSVAQAVLEPPEDTRAYFRGKCLERYADSVAAASWDSVIFDLPGRDALQRVPTLEPLRGTRAHVGELLDRSRTAEDLLRALSGR